jgi:hypothetical protein
VYIAPANIFYKDSAIATAYQKAIPSSYSTSGCDALRGEWCVYPRIRFMFGQMEGKVWPYADSPFPDEGGIPTPTPTPPPVISLSATPLHLSFPGQSAYMLWTVQNATSCTASGAWSGAKAMSGTALLTPSQTSTYTLSCTGAGGTSQASIVISVGGTGNCHRYGNRSTIPQGFGVPWDVTNPSSMLLKASCSTGSVILELGDNHPYTYIYKTAYLTRPGATSWAPITLLGSNLISNAWYPAHATAVVPMTDNVQSQTSTYVGYLCKWNGTR